MVVIILFVDYGSLLREKNSALMQTKNSLRGPDDQSGCLSRSGVSIICNLMPNELSRSQRKTLYNAEILKRPLLQGREEENPEWVWKPKKSSSNRG